jgi:hypothetical protein
VNDSPYNAFTVAQEQFDRAAVLLELRQAERDLPASLFENTISVSGGFG